MEIILGQARRRWSEEKSGRWWPRRLLKARRFTVLRAGITSAEACYFARRKEYRGACADVSTHRFYIRCGRRT